MAITAAMVKELRELTGAGMMDCKKALTETNGDKEKAIEFLREKGLAAIAKKANRIAAEGLANIFTEGNKAVILEVNCETDFVTKNSEFVEMIENIGKAILNSNAQNLDEIMELDVEGQTVNEYIIAKTAKIGEKLSLRRAMLVEKNDDENFGAYLHMGGKIAVLTVVEGATSEVAREVAMQAAAMNPSYLSREDVPEDVIAKEREVLKEQAINEGKNPDIAEKIVNGRIEKFYKENCLIHQAFVKDGDIDVETYVKNNGGVVKTMIRYEVGEGMEKRNENFAEEVAKQIEK